MSAPSLSTSERHRAMLDGYQSGNAWHGWAKEKLGDIALTEWSYGRAALVWEIDDRFVLMDGVVFGGHIACVADHVAAIVTLTALSEADDRFRTARLETNFFRPVRRPRLMIEARIVNVSSTLIHAEADFTTPEGKRAVRITAVQSRRKERPSLTANGA